MINFENIYEDNSGKLTLVRVYKPGKSYITEDGTRIKYLGSEGGTLKFDVINRSPLEDDVKLSEFERPNALELFWKLSNKALKNEHTD